MVNGIRPTDWGSFSLYFPESFSITPERKGSEPRSKDDFNSQMRNWLGKDVFSFVEGDKGISIYLNTRTPVELLSGDSYQDHFIPKVINPIKQGILEELASVEGELNQIRELFTKGFKPFQGFSPLEIKKEKDYLKDSFEFLSAGQYTEFDFFIGMISGDFRAKNKWDMPDEDRQYFDELRGKDLVLPYNSLEPAHWAAAHYAKADTIQQSLKNLIFLCEQHPRFEKAGLFKSEEETSDSS